MPGAEPWGFGAAGPALAIAAMALATYLCRIAGVVLMRFVRLNGPIERALAALPGAIVAATVLPLAVGSGPAACAGVAVGILLMARVRHEVAALVGGLAVAAAARAIGL